MAEKDKDIEHEAIRKEAKLKGKASFMNWMMAGARGQDPVQYERESRERTNQKWVAYSDYVRDNGETTPDKSKPQKGEKKLSQVDFTLNDIKRVIDERLDERLVSEREHTRQLVRSEVSEQFESFIKDNFTPAMDGIDQRFDRLEDRVDHLAGDVAELRIDTRHVKQALRTKGLNAPA